MSIIFLEIILLLINYAYCLDINLTKYPEKIVPGEEMKIKFDLKQNYDDKEYTIVFKLCNINCTELGQKKTKGDDTIEVFAGANDDPCFFSNQPVDNWQIVAETNFKDHTDTVNSRNITRELICFNPLCVPEIGCPNYAPINNATDLPIETSNRDIEPSNAKADNVEINTDNQQIDNIKKVDDNKRQKYIFYSVLSLSIMVLAILFISVLYVKKFKKKEDDPIPVFSVEESSYCYDGNTHSPPLASASYNSAVMERSFLSSKSGNGQTKYCHSPKAADQSHLSVQLHPINSVNDGFSHSSQNSNRSRGTTAALSIKSSQKIDTSDINIKISNPDSPNFTSLSPVSMASTIPFIPTQKSNKKKSVRSDKKHNLPPSPHVYSDTPIVIEKKGSNSYLFANTSMVSEARSKISEKRSFQSSRTGSEVEAKVLSSKHYVLSNFEGDDSKEELNLHYGDIVSVINILPDGWAYGELLLKYNHYESNGNPKTKTNEPEYRRFGYYPIKCLSPDEEDEVMPSNDKKENLPELKSLASSNGNGNGNANNGQNDKAPLPRTLNPSENSTNNIYFAHPRSVGNNSNMTHHKSKSSRGSKRSSIFNMLKRSSKDYSKEALVYYNEPHEHNEKYNSRDFSDTESSAGTVYHDAEETEQHRSSIDPKRISVRSSFSYRSYM